MQNQLSIYYADPDTALLSIAEMALASMGRVRTFPHGKGLLTALHNESTPPDLVFVSIDLPGFLMERFVGLLRIARIQAPVIATATSADKELVLSLMRNGFMDFLEKPFGCDSLMACARRILDGTGKQVSGENWNVLNPNRSSRELIKIRHDLRNYLASVSGYTQMIRSRIDEPALVSYCHKIERTLDSMGTLMELCNSGFLGIVESEAGVKTVRSDAGVA